MTWHNANEVVPGCYDVLGIEFSEQVLGKDEEGNYYIVSLWDNETWRATTGERPSIIYWKELE